MGLLASIFGGAKSNAQQVRSVGEDGFVDLDFPLESHARNSSGGVTLRARGILDKRPVGFSIEIHAAWKESPLEGGGAIMYWGKVTIRSIGPASDNFVAALARLYGFPVPGKGMLPAIDVEAVGLNSDPRRLETEPVHMKLFFNSDSSEDRYAEVFQNTNLPAKLLQFHEKDEGYRQPLVRALYEVAQQTHAALRDP
jgi:hypothetical protein